MPTMISRYLDIVYLVLWSVSKVDNKVSWEKPATVAIFMAFPIMLAIETVMLLTEKWNGVGLLGSLVPNRIGYVVFVFVPIWLVVLWLFSTVNRRANPNDRLSRLRESTTRITQVTCTVSYFAVPVAGILLLLIISE